MIAKSLKADVSALASDKGLTLETSAFKLFTWPTDVINSVDNTKLPCYTLPPTQYHSLSRNLPPLWLS